MDNNQFNLLEERLSMIYQQLEVIDERNRRWYVWCALIIIALGLIVTLTIAIT